MLRSEFLDNGLPEIVQVALGPGLQTLTTFRFGQDGGLLQDFGEDPVVLPGEE